jgi:hypothetical protein
LLLGSQWSAQKDGSSGKGRVSRSKLDKFSILNQKKLLNSESSFDTFQTIISEKEKESKRIRNELDNIFEVDDYEEIDPNFLSHDAAALLSLSISPKPKRGRKPLIGRKIPIGEKRKSPKKRLSKLEPNLKKFIRRQPRASKENETTAEFDKSNQEQPDHLKKIGDLMQRLSPSKNLSMNPENPNEPSDNIQKSRGSFMKTELTRLMSHQNPNQYSLLFNTMSAENRSKNKKLLRSEKILAKRKHKKIKKTHPKE